MTVPRPNAKDRRAQTTIAAQLGSAGFALPGTILVRHTSCKKPGCRCGAEIRAGRRDRRRKINGKTVTRRLTEEQMERYRAWFDNAKRIRELTAELEALSLDIANSAEGWS